MSRNRTGRGARFPGFFPVVRKDVSLNVIRCRAVRGRSTTVVSWENFVPGGCWYDTTSGPHISDLVAVKCTTVDCDASCSATRSTSDALPPSPSADIILSDLEALAWSFNATLKATQKRHTGPVATTNATTYSKWFVECNGDGVTCPPPRLRRSLGRITEAPHKCPHSR